MAKILAKLDAKSFVENVLWCSDLQVETAVMKDPGDRAVGIGDTYRAGKWFRDGAEILTQKEILQVENDDMRKALEIMGVSVNG